jgi:sortase A
MIFKLRIMTLPRFFAWLAIATGGLCLANAAYIPMKGMLADVLMERAWAQSQEQGSPALPWPWIDAQPLARLSVPRLGTSEILLNVGTGQALGFAPAHMQETPRPGQPGLSVIGAHKNTHFAFLEDINIDDIIEVENIDRSITRFRVIRLEIADKYNSGIDVNAPKTTAQIALVTCYPFTALSYGGALRYIVYGEAVLV